MKMCFFCFSPCNDSSCPSLLPPKQAEQQENPVKGNLQFWTVFQIRRSPSWGGAGRDRSLGAPGATRLCAAGSLRSERADGPGLRKAGHRVPSLETGGKALLLKDPSCWPGGEWLGCSQLSVCLSVLPRCGEMEDLAVPRAPSQKRTGKALLEKKKYKTSLLFRGLQRYSQHLPVEIAPDLQFIKKQNSNQKKLNKQKNNPQKNPTKPNPQL